MFRAKQIPTPIAKIGGKTSGAMKKVALAASSGIRADLENFAFDVKVVVASYTMGFTKKNGLLDEVKVNSNRFTPEIKAKIKTLSRNSKVFFENIKVKMPDGSTRTLPPIAFKII